MARDFPLGRINVRRAASAGSSDLWGPHLWSFPACSSATANDGMIPYGVTITSVSLMAFLGNMKPSSDLATSDDISTDLIDPSYTPQVVDDTNVSAKFQWPGDVYKGEKATLIFLLTLSNLAVHPFFWQYIYIE